MIEYLDILDKQILIWIHQHFSNTIFDILMPLITNVKNWGLPIVLIIFGLGFRLGKKGKITLILLIITLSLTDSICAQILKPLFERIRPSHLNLDEINLLVPRGGKWSMPSNHAANIFSFAVILTYFYKNFGTILFLLAFLISFSRVYVGVHFPGDIIIGSIIGYTIGWIILTCWANLKIYELKKGETWVLYKNEPKVFLN